MKTVITEDPESFFRVRLVQEPTPFSMPGGPAISQHVGMPLDKLEKLLTPGSTFYFVRSAGNPAVVEATAKQFLQYAKKGQLSSTLRAGKRVSFRPFDADVLGTYMGWINETIKSRTSYPLVRSSMFPPTDSGLWPWVHAFKSEEAVENFRDAVGRLHSDEAFEYIKEKEAPQNYKLKTFEFIRKLGLPPVVIHDRRLVLPAEVLRDTIDFLAQHRYSEDTRDYGPPIYVD